MAENERFVMGKGICIDKYCRDYFRCDNCENNTGKTREEYEHMIAESIYNCSAASKKMYWIKVKQNPHLYTSSFIKDILKQAKAVCDTLFGKSK